jgi:hypothetical protein
VHVRELARRFHITEATKIRRMFPDFLKRTAPAVVPRRRCPAKVALLKRYPRKLSANGTYGIPGALLFGARGWPDLFRGWTWRRSRARLHIFKNQADRSMPSTSSGSGSVLPLPLPLPFSGVLAPASEPRALPGLRFKCTGARITAGARAPGSCVIDGSRSRARHEQQRQQQQQQRQHEQRHAAATAAERAHELEQRRRARMETSFAC